MPGEKILRSMPMYDRKLKARVIPWSHYVNTWVGYIYIFDDPKRDDILIYFVPEEGSMTFHIHRTKAVLDDVSATGYRLRTHPDPTTDPEVAAPVVIDPTPSD